MTDQTDFRGLTADIVGHYVSHNRISGAELPALIASIHAALAGTAQPQSVEAERPAPAVPLRRAVTPDAVICLFDGRPFKSIKRHLEQAHGMSPADYREYWGLPKDSLMVAPNYSALRSDTAKQMGLGAGGRGSAKEAPAAASKGRDGAPPARDDIAPVAPPKRRGRAPAR